MLRFPNVVGERSTHGAVHDFITRLRKDLSRLDVLGDGSQTKPYLYVQDLVRAIPHRLRCDLRPKRMHRGTLGRLPRRRPRE